MKWFVLTLLYYIPISSSISLTDFHYYPCNSKTNYPVTVQNLNLYYTEAGGVNIVRGDLYSTIDITGPVRTDVLLKRYIWPGIWIYIPCDNNAGSCRYNDLCKYAPSSPDDCPDSFKTNNVPCSCPIPMGNYSIPASFTIGKPKNSIITGKYGGRVRFLQSNTEISCYDINFKLWGVDLHSHNIVPTD